MIARATRLSSPPDAIRASGRAGSPAFGAKPEDDLVDPARVERDRVAVDLDRRLVASAGRRPSADLEHAGREAELARAPPSTAAPSPAGRRRRAADRSAAAAATRSRSRASSAWRRARARRRGRAAARPPRPRARRGRSPPPRRRRTVARGRRSRDSRSASRASSAGSWSTRLGEVADRLADVVELRLEAGQALGERLEPGVEPGRASRASRRSRPRSRSRAPPLLARRAPRQAVAPPRAIASPCWAASSRARISSASPGRRRAAAISFASCSASSSRRVSSRGSSSRVAEQASGSRASASTAAAVAARSVRVAAERVEEVALPALVEEPLLVVLAVDLDQRPATSREPGGRDRLVVQPGRRPARGGHLASGDQRLRQAIEQRADARGLGAVPDEGRVRARAGREPEGVDQQALPGARSRR